MFGLVTALTLALLATPDPTGLPSTPVPEAVSDARIMTSIRQAIAGTETGKVLAVLAPSFPNDYAALEQQMLARARAATLDPVAINEMGAAFASNIMARHMDRVVQASTTDLVALSSVRLDLIKALQQGHAAACHEFVEAGLSPVRIAELGVDGSRSLERLSQAVIGIIARPPGVTPHPEPATEAWEAIGRRYADMGGNPVWIAALFGDRNYSGQSHADRCANAVLWETAVSEATPEVRAYYISALYVVPPAPAAP
tara:strand:+ start:5006 stop:5773 length:768 start_codon:yes stop_codon:yes gene_type:complete